MPADLGGRTWPPATCGSPSTPPSAPSRSREAHVAFAVEAEDFAAVAARIRAAGAGVWCENRRVVREPERGASVYVLDPIGHRLEVHVGTLASRLAAPRPGYEVYGHAAAGEAGGA